jgi:cbb3-type cytochrome oxidase subunit 3
MILPRFLIDAQIFSLIAICLTFAGIVVYALWPSLQSNFDRASRLPLNED